MINEFLFLFVYLAQAALIWFAVKYDQNHTLEKYILIFIITNFFLTSRAIPVFGLNLNIGNLFLINTYLITYLLIIMRGVQEFIQLIRNIALCSMMMFLITQPVLMMNSISLEPSTELINKFFELRTSNIVLTFGIFVIFQTLYAVSFYLYKNKYLIIDFLIRTLIFITLQSITFYFWAYQFNIIQIDLNSAITLFLNGMIAKVTLLICVTPLCYYLLDLHIKNRWKSTN